MENYGDETLWETLAHPKSSEGCTMWFSSFFFVSATFPTPKLFVSLATARAMRGSNILSWNLRAPLWHYLKLSFLLSLCVFSVRHEASSSSEGERGRRQHEGWYTKDKLLLPSLPSIHSRSVPDTSWREHLRRAFIISLIIAADAASVKL